MTCPKKSSCLCLIVFINVRWTPAALSTSRLLFFSVHEIFSILPKNHISTALSLSFIVSEIVHYIHITRLTIHNSITVWVNTVTANTGGWGLGKHARTVQWAVERGSGVGATSRRGHWELVLGVRPKVEDGHAGDPVRRLPTPPCWIGPYPLSVPARYVRNVKISS